MRRVLLGLITLLILAATFITFLLGTGAGGRLALGLARGFFPDDLHLEVEDFSGRLIDRFELRGVSFVIPTLAVEVSRVAVDWNAIGLLARRIDVQSAVVEQVQVELLAPPSDSAAPPPLPDQDQGAPEPPAADLPFEISFDSLHVSEVAFRMQDTLWLSTGSATVSGRLDSYRLEFSGSGAPPGSPMAEVTMTGTGSTTEFHADTLELQALDGVVSGTADVSWWPEVIWSARVEGEELAPAPMLPEPDEWPGRVSFSVHAEGRIDAAGAIEAEVVVDTVSGVLRGEALEGRFDARLEREKMLLDAAIITWGPARVTASGIVGETIDADFDATVPDLSLMVPGSSGRLTATGRASGTVETIRIQATFAADSLLMDSMSAARVRGEADLELGDEAPRIRTTFAAATVAADGLYMRELTGEADLDLDGAVTGTVIARNVEVQTVEIDSAAVELSGLIDRHRVSVSAVGPEGGLDLRVTGGLSPDNEWIGTVQSLRLASDSAGTWVLAEPVTLAASAEAIELGEACLESAPARICAAGRLSEALTSARFTADSFEVAWLAPLMPDDLSAQALIEANIDVELVRGHALSGNVALRTSPGHVALVAAGDPRTLSFEPITLSATSGPDGMDGELDLDVTDETGARLLSLSGRLTSPAAIHSLEDLDALQNRPYSLRMDLAAEDLLLLTADLVPDWYATGGLHGAVDLESDGEGGLSGSLDVEGDSLVILGTVRGQDRVWIVEPARLQATVGPGGLAGELDLDVSDEAGAGLLSLSGRLNSPAAIRSLDDFGSLVSRPFSLQMDLAAEDLLLFTSDLMPAWDASGGLRGAVDLESDEKGRLSGSLDLHGESLVLRSTVRGQGWVLAAEPARLQATVGTGGLEGELDLAMDVEGLGSLVTATGRVSMPRLTSLDVDPERQPVDGRLDVAVTDMSIVEAFLIDLSEASGTFELYTEVAGTLADMTVQGQASLRDGRVLVPALGLSLNGMQLSASGDHDGTVEIDGEVRSGEGRITIQGRSARYPSREDPNVIQVRGERFTALDIPEVRVVIEPALDVLFDGSTLQVNGRVDVPRARIGIPEVPEAAVTPSRHVVFVGDTTTAREPPVPLGADLTVTLGSDVFFNGLGLTGNLQGGLDITQRPGGEPSARGELRILNGIYRALGQQLRIDPGRLVFNGPLNDPGVEARAFKRASDQTEAGFQIGGTLQNLDITTYSVPPKPESDVMAYILFGRPMSQTTGTEGAQASNTAAVLGANMLAMSLAPSLGLDEARIETGSSQNKAQLVVGRYLSPRLFVGYGVGIYEPISTFRVRYLLSAKWSVEAITGDQQSTDLLYRIETGGPKVEEPEDVEVQID